MPTIMTARRRKELPIEVKKLVKKRIPFGLTIGDMWLSGVNQHDIARDNYTTLAKVRAWVSNTIKIINDPYSVTLLTHNRLAVDCIRIWYGLNIFDDYMTEAGSLNKVEAYKIYSYFNRLGLIKMKEEKFDESL